MNHALSWIVSNALLLQLASLHWCHLTGACLMLKKRFRNTGI